jgi:hypothetical protein
MSFCARGKFWEKEPHTHSPPPLSVVGVSNNSFRGDGEAFLKPKEVIFKHKPNKKTSFIFYLGIIIWKI